MVVKFAKQVCYVVSLRSACNNSKLIHNMGKMV